MARPDRSSYGSELQFTWQGRLRHSEIATTRGLALKNWSRLMSYYFDFELTIALLILGIGFLVFILRRWINRQ